MKTIIFFSILYLFFLISISAAIAAEPTNEVMPTAGLVKKAAAIAAEPKHFFTRSLMLQVKKTKRTSVAVPLWGGGIRFATTTKVVATKIIHLDAALASRWMIPRLATQKVARR